jgi:hypothetical protein
MRGADLEARKAVERAFEDQMRQRDRGFERVADRVGAEAAVLEAPTRIPIGVDADERQFPLLPGPRDCDPVGLSGVFLNRV